MNDRLDGSGARPRGRRDLVLSTLVDATAEPGGFEVRGRTPLVVAAPATGRQPYGWVVFEHDAGAPFTLLFDQGRGVHRPGRSRVLPATNGRGLHLLGLPASPKPLRLLLDADAPHFRLTRLVAHELGAWGLFFFLLDWERRERGPRGAIEGLSSALRNVARGPGTALIESRLARQRRSVDGERWDDTAGRSLGARRAAVGERTDELERAEHLERTRAELDAFLRDGKPLVLPKADRPDLSILVVVQDRAALTLACLRSIARSLLQVTIEVILFDNASTDETARMLPLVEGVESIRSPTNQGFVGAVNEAARRARGRVLVLLNNDAELAEGTLAAAYSTLSSDESIGIVGGRIVLLDSTLQEAGSIVWRDGSCAGYGRGDDPDQPPYRFRRDVDFCSGVFLLIRADLWQELGGFDQGFAPAYYEDVDLCLRARAAGRRVVYEPAALVRHFESATAGKSLATDLQLRNRSYLVSRHAAVLESKLEPVPRNLLEARTAAGSRRRVLVLDDAVPHPFEGSGSPRLRAILGLLLEQGFEVTFYPTQFPDEDWRVVDAALPGEVEVMLGRGAEELKQFLEERRGFYRALLVSRPHNMRNLAAIRERWPELFTGVRLLYDAEALFAMRDVTWAKLHHDGKAQAKAELRVAAEVDLARGADRVCAVSAHERDLFARRGVDVVVLPHAIEVAPTPAAFHERRRFLFVGPLRPETTPNVEGLLWLLDHVLPHLRLRLPGCEVVVAGRNENEALRARRDAGVQLVGAIDDLGPLYDASRVFVAPIRFAAGVPIKILEAAAYGLPVVTTDLLVEQLGWVAGEHLLSSPVDDAETFADHCVRLASDEALWRAVRAAALERVRVDCDSRAAAATLSGLLADR